MVRDRVSVTVNMVPVFVMYVDMSTGFHHRHNQNFPSGGVHSIFASKVDALFSCRSQYTSYPPKLTTHTLHTSCPPHTPSHSWGRGALTAYPSKL